MVSKKIVKTLLLTPPIERRILLLRGQKVMLDRDLAELYGVETKRLNEQVRRNAARFPEDFMFQLTTEESDALAMVVSEETGQIALAVRGELETDLSISQLRELLTRYTAGRSMRAERAPAAEWKRAL